MNDADSKAHDPPDTADSQPAKSTQGLNMPSQPPKGGSRSLAGQTVLVTRAASQAADLVQRITAAGGRAIVHPVIEIGPVEYLGDLDSAIADLARFDLIVFASRNGVRFFQQAMKAAGHEMPSSVRIAAIGSSTAELIHELWQVDPTVPGQADSRGLADFLIDRFSENKMLLVRGNRGSDVLKEKLSAAGVDFRSVVAYRSVDVTTADPNVVSMLEAGEIDWVTATSSAIGKSAVRLFEGLLDDGGNGKRAKLVSISPTTSAAIDSAGGKVFAEAKEFNLDGLVEAMKRAKS
jgi:uroporphyrinogen III methyltransferase/synthase